jgi:hypothetical protein
MPLAGLVDRDQRDIVFGSIDSFDDALRRLQGDLVFSGLAAEEYPDVRLSF